MKPIIVIAKGEHARRVPPSGHYHVAACSEAVRLCDRCEYLAVNDVPALGELTGEDFAKSARLIMPAFLHVDSIPSGFVHAGFEIARVFNSLPVYSHETPQCTYYRLHTDPEPSKYKGIIPYFGRCRSVSDSLIAWLLHAGYRNFALLGISTTRIQSYHKMFKRRFHKTNDHRCSIWNTTEKRLKKHNAAYRSIRSDEQLQQWTEECERVPVQA